MTSRARNVIVFAVKATVAAALITWLVKSSALDFAALRLLVDRPMLLLMDLGLFGLGVFIATMRWRLLLGICGVSAPFMRLVQLQLTAVFFNNVIPGNVGGDVLKALYVARDAEPSKRTAIVLIAFVERALGLAALIAIATVIAVVRAPILFGDPLLSPIVSVVCALGIGMVLGVLFLVLLLRYGGDRLKVWTSGPSRIAKMLRKLALAVQLLSAGPRMLALAFALSMASNAAAIGFFTVLSSVIIKHDVPYATVATLFPLGLLAASLPIAPAGLGVGHVAFDRLYASAGLEGGATVFNVYLLGQIAPCLVGVFPYLTLKRRGELQRDPHST